MSRRFPPTTESAPRRTHSVIDRPNEAGFYIPPPAYIAYEKMHKRFVGPKTANKLLGIYHDLADEESVDCLSAAGWAAAEAALVATDRPEEDRLGYLDNAVEVWDMAIGRRREGNMARGLTEDYQDPALERIQLARLFAQLMEGMVKGDVTKEIRAKLYDDLLVMAAQNAVGLVEALRQQKEGGLHIGLAHEINAMLAVNRLQSPTLIAMPAIGRADSGRYHPEQTHDIDLLHLDWGQVNGVTTIESKARPKEKHYRRYEAAIVGGRIHLYTKNGTSPVDTVLLFLKEDKGQLTYEERDELEAMTDTLVHLARHQYAKDPAVPPHCRDIERCELVPRHRSGTPFLRKLAAPAIALASLPQ